MKKTYIIFVTVLVGVLLLWLFFSNSIIGGMSDNSNPCVADFETYSTKGNMISSLDKVEYHGDIFETVTIQGWAFVETLEDNSNRYSRLILKNDKNCYEIPLNDPEDPFTYSITVVRNDVIEAFQNREIYSNKIGFLDEANTYSIDYGTYDAYLYCWENDSAYGLAHTGKCVVKTSNSIELVPWQSSICNIGDITDADSLTKYSIDTITLQDDRMSVNGWAFIDGKDCSNQNVYVVVNDKQYTTMCKERRDIVNGFQSENYAMSGYHASIPLDDIPEGALTLQVIVEQDGMYYKGTSVTVTRTGETIKRTDVAPVQTADECVKIDLTAYQTADITSKMFVDKIEVANDKVGITGWAFVDEMDCTNQKVYVSINGTAYTSVQRSRPDVGKGYGNAMYDMSGYHTSVPIDSFTQGNNRVQIIVENDGVLYYGNQIAVTRNGSDIFKGDAPASEPQTEQYSVVDISAFSKAEATSKFSVDAISYEDGKLNITGWAFVDEMDCTNQKVYVSVNGTVHTTIQRLRADVGKGYGNAIYDMSGYHTEVPMDSLPEDEFTLQLIVQHDNVLYECKPAYVSVNGTEISVNK